MNESVRLLTVRGIDIRVHVSFTLILIFAVLQFGVFTGQGVTGAFFGITVTLLLFGIVVLHELGHSIAAQRFGVKPVAPTDSMFAVQQRMAEQKLDAVPVVEAGRIVGLLTNRDVSELYRLLSSNPGLLPLMARNNG